MPTNALLVSDDLRRVDPRLADTFRRLKAEASAIPTADLGGDPGAACERTSDRNGSVATVGRAPHVARWPWRSHIGLYREPARSAAALDRTSYTTWSLSAGNDRDPAARADDYR